MRNRALLPTALLLASCAGPPPPATNVYFDSSGRDDVLSGGVKMVEVTTPSGAFHIWTKRVGNNPRIKVLLLHGGPGATHEYWEAADSYLPAAGIEYYYYDQLGSFYSDQPSDPSLWEVDRFVDEVEQVRQALGLTSENFYLVGHSWGGALAIEYALAHQENLKGLVISNMMASGPAYNEYAHEVLMPRLDPEVLAEILGYEEAGEYENPRYMELLMQYYYVEHILRMPPEEWPNPVQRAFEHLNNEVYIPMQGPSEMGLGGKLLDWDRSGDLGKISVPTLVIGAQHDTMDPKYMEWMAGQLPKGRYLYCADGSHMAMYDDQATYFDGLVDFVEDVDSGRF